jgi:hypothetical protein
MDDADVDQAVELAHRALFFNQVSLQSVNFMHATTSGYLTSEV